MLAEDGGSTAASAESLFCGVRFVLFGFDSVSSSQYRSELVRRGGVDVGRYDSSCTHVVTSGLTYDDPVCVAARKDGKILVTELWIEDCVDFSKLADASRILYKPVKDSNGIPGSDSLYICLTGYQRPERDDIMKMVELMGAHFSKPLIATKITHLICYKFEGEKYELAKRVNIKLVNHRWLEDCLREWKILPTENYTKSGWELEALEAQAQDSEDDLETANTNRLVDKARLSANTDIPSETKMVDSDNKLPNIQDNGRVERSVDASQMGSLSKLSSDYNLTRSVFHTDAKNSYNSGSPSNTEGKKLPSGSRLGLSSFKSVPERSISSFRKTPAKPVDVENSNCMIDASAQGDSIQSKPGDDPESREISVSCQNPDTSIHGNTDVHTVSLESKQKRSSNSGIPYLQKRKMGDQNSISCSVSSSHQEPDAHLLSKSSTGSKAARLEPESTANSSKKHNQTLVHDVANRSNNHFGGLISSESNMTNVFHEQQSNTSTPLRHKRRSPTGGLQLSGSNNVGSPGTLAAKSDPVRETGDHHYPALGLTTKVPSSRNLMSDTTIIDKLEAELKQAALIGTSKGKYTEPDDSRFLAGSRTDSMEVCKRKIPDGISNKIEDNNKVLKKDDWIGNPKVLDFDRSRTPVSESPKVSEASKDMPSHVGSKPDVKKPLQDEKMMDAGNNTAGTVVKENLPQGETVEATANADDVVADGKRAAQKPEKKKGGKHVVSRAKKRVKAEEACSKEVVTDESTKSVICITLESDVNVIPVVTSPNVCKDDKAKPHSDETMKPTEVESLCDAQMDNANAVAGDKAVKESGVVEAENASTVAEDPVIKETERPLKTRKIKGGKRTLACNKKNVAAESCSTGVNVKEKKVLGPKIPDPHVNQMPVAEGSNSEDKAKAGTDDVVVFRAAIKERSCEIEMEDASRGSDVIHDSKAVVEAEKKDKSVKNNANHSEKSVGLDTSPEKVAKKLKKALSSVSNDTAGKVGQEERDLSKYSEKENTPLDDSVTAPKHSKNRGEATLIGKKILSGAKKCIEKKVKPESDRVLKVIKPEPAVFILSGHRYQRKELQKIIRQLRGRVCRDSHQWSYQATHFIAPEPLRRTEKLFAAAAAGRWILKMDYLTACNEAGKLLDEQPYEWHQSGFSEDGAISLEAPRKWRLLRERTGHGAFYGFRVIVYGECIAPSLDTLKRVIKAGDGTLVATSPPYTRFLDSGVDLAVISPGMPRVDAWVQEFLRHDIPCVLADYLVEYVCKPGYPLDRHVLFNTLDWANKSLASLLGRSEEVVSTEPGDDDVDDISCAVCSSRDRAGVMLICGSEDGASGCGVGTHIDCCDPPLESVPEEDWYCSKCSENRADGSAPAGKKVKASRKRRL